MCVCAHKNIETQNSNTNITPLSVKRRQLERQWTHLHPILQHALPSLFTHPSPPSFDNFLLAYSVYWSRACALPLMPGGDVPVTQQHTIPTQQLTTQTQQADARGERNARGEEGNARGKENTTENNKEKHDVDENRRSVSMQQHAQQGFSLLQGPLHGLIPLLDFCNHAAGASCRWTVHGGPWVCFGVSWVCFGVSWVCFGVSWVCMYHGCVYVPWVCVCIMGVYVSWCR